MLPEAQEIQLEEFRGSKRSFQAAPRTHAKAAGAAVVESMKTGILAPIPEKFLVSTPDFGAPMKRALNAAPLLKPLCPLSGVARPTFLRASFGTKTCHSR